MTEETKMSMDRIEDRLAVADVVHAYAEGVDDGDCARVASLFAPDCVFRAFAGPKGEARGIAEVEKLLDRLLTTFRMTSHHVSNSRIAFDGADRAAATTALHAWHRFVEERPDGLLWGRYVDTFVRIDGSWLFAERELRIAGESEFPFAWIPMR
ncbi:nuclear transport factor 2 family protein [Aeromicrobium wangtongii]|uniref:nuclear transport factor 2 family protein n=1 Tax=Aeromicrobium wangtongii TaxID=2969247 RepID=UPI0020176430|nr:nuclear transport factor 2 family protein [Aeromicrobium wangtongii]MCL3819855.1 nuclear transport factor 2 family protein [Aeromicrobium wangtongii]